MGTSAARILAMSKSCFFAFPVMMRIAVRFTFSGVMRMCCMAWSAWSAVGFDWAFWSMSLWFTMASPMALSSRVIALSGRCEPAGEYRSASLTTVSSRVSSMSGLRS